MPPVGAHRSRIRRVVVAATAIAVSAPALVHTAASQGASATAGLPPVVAVPQVAGTASATQATPRYVFPVFGTNAKFSSDYGAPRAGTGWHHGNDIFAPIGTPVLAIADGVLSKVGVNTLGGNRLWLRDGLGNTYYYAHLSGYASQIKDGVRVRAGEIIAFVGNTGQAITTPPHLHFEIHPGDGPSVDPYPYLLAWQRGTDVALAFTAAVAARGQAPAVGAVLVGQEPPVEQRDDLGDGLAEAVP
jgi:murein DD-endopeptidase MepM/ murein hydrolase activator NlpD